MGALIRPVIVIVLIATLLVVIPPSTALSDENGSESLPSVVLIEQAYRNGKIDYDTAIQYKVSSIFDPRALPAEYQSTTPAKCATPILLEVNANWETLKHETRDNLSAYPVGRPGSALLRPGLSGEVTYSTTHFQIHYTTSGTDAVPTTDVSPSNGIPDYIDNMGTELENVWTKELSNMGWLQPTSDVSADGNSDYDVYVHDMPYYGYTQPENWADQGTALGDNENSSGITEVNAVYGYIALENDYAGFPLTPMDCVRVTAAHEFNHAIQFGYDYFEETWLMEATATWIEDEVYDSVNDNLQYLTSYFNNPDVAMSNQNPSLHWYADWIFPRYISEHHGGQSTIRSIWENSVNYDSYYGSYSFSAVQDALSSAATSLAAVFNNFTVANYVMSTSPTNNPYCYEEASSYPSVYIEGNLNFSGSVVNYTPSDGIGNYAADYITISSTTDLIQITVSGTSSSITYAARVIGMQSGVPTVTDISLSGSPDSGSITLSTASYDTVILIVLNETPDSSSLTMSNYSVQVRVGDVTPPTMEAIVEAEGAYYNTAPVLSNFGFDDETALDDGWYQMGSYTGSWTSLFTDVSGTEWNSDSWTIPGFGDLSEGSNTIYFRASDDVGNLDGESGEWSWQFYKDTVAPADPTSVNSTSHTVSTWSSDNTVDIGWIDAIDSGSGLDGYSVLWDTSAATIPDQNKDIEEGVQSANSTALADGNSNYFHITSVDNAGNWQSTVHVGPFFIDANPPADPTSVNSTSHTVSTWSSDNTVDIGWIDAIDSGSGLDGYSVLWDTSAATLPDQNKDIEEGVQSASSTGLADGSSHYFHIISVDNFGNWQSTVHYGPFYIAVNCPILSEGTVNPTSGYTSASFTYSVNYTDFEDDAPDSIKISIDSGASVNMTARAGQDGDFTNGEIYEYIISGGTLGTGSHTFQFFANDGTDDAIGDIDVNAGPTVSQAVAGGGGGGGGGEPPPGVTKVIDVMSSKGEFKENVTCKSEDECVELYIPENTFAKRITGGPIYTIKIIESEDPPPAPEQTNLIGLVYDFSPEGITFDPAVDLTIKYDESLMTEGVNENSLIIAIWDSDAGKWVELEGTVDPENNTVTTKIGHFTEYTILVHTTPASFTGTNLSIVPKEIDLGESATVSVTVTNTGDLSGEYELYLKTDDVISQTKEITLTGGSSQQVTFSVAKDVVGECCVDINGLTGSFVINEEAPVVEEEIEPTPKPAAIPVPETIPTPQPPFNWGFLVGILAGVAAIGSATYYVVRKRMKAKGSG